MKFVALMLVLLLLLLFGVSCDGFAPSHPGRLINPNPSLWQGKSTKRAKTVSLFEGKNLGCSSDERGRLSKATIRAKIVKESTNFREGAMFVHNNYLGLWYKAFIGVVTVNAAIVTVLGLARFISPMLYSQTLGALTGMIKTMAVPSRIYVSILRNAAYLPLCLPMLMVHMILLSLKGIPLVVARMFQHFGWVSTAASILLMRKNVFAVVTVPVAKALKAFVLMTESLTKWEITIRDCMYSPFLLGVLVSAPVVEEVVFRSVLARAFSVCRGLRERRVGKSKSTTIEQPAVMIRTPTRLWFGQYKTWAIVSAILFSGSHVDNWYGGYDFASELLPEVKLLSAISQVTITSIVALDVFVPVYETYDGLAAAVGSHATWNLLSNLFIVNLPLRLAIRFFRNGSKPKTEPKSGYSRPRLRSQS